MAHSWRDPALAACRLLGDAIGGRAIDPSTLPDEATLLGFAKAHRLVTLISSALQEGGVPAERYAALHAAAERAAFHQTKNDLLSAAVLERLTAREIPVLPLKGAALQAVYPRGWIRTATDTDWFVTPDRLPDAAAVLTEMGFTQNSAHDGDVCFQKPPRSVIELHTTLGGYSKKQRRALARLALTPFTVCEHYAYTLFHLYTHFLYAGAGVRLFLDMYCLSRAVTDRTDVERWLKELDLLAFDRAVHTVCGILFDGDVCSGDMAQAVDLVLTSGTFGTAQTYHAMKNAAQSITHKNRTERWLHDYGFTRAAMSARYPVLKRHAWLYPACAVHRIAHGVLFKRTVLKSVADVAHAADRDQIQRILKTMQIL